MSIRFLTCAGRCPCFTPPNYSNLCTVLARLEPYRSQRWTRRIMLITRTIYTTTNNHWEEYSHQIRKYIAYCCTVQRVCGPPARKGTLLVPGANSVADSKCEGHELRADILGWRIVIAGLEVESIWGLCDSDRETNTSVGAKRARTGARDRSARG
jgi:hypothetical protein